MGQHIGRQAGALRQTVTTCYNDSASDVSRQRKRIPVVKPGEKATPVYRLGDALSRSLHRENTPMEALSCLTCLTWAHVGISPR